MIDPENLMPNNKWLAKKNEQLKVQVEAMKMVYEQHYQNLPLITLQTNKKNHH